MIPENKIYKMIWEFQSCFNDAFVKLLNKHNITPGEEGITLLYSYPDKGDPSIYTVVIEILKGSKFIAGLKQELSFDSSGNFIKYNIYEIFRKEDKNESMV